MADTCPRCGAAGVGADKCPACGVAIRMYQAYLDKLRMGPSAPAPAAAPDAPATAAAAQPAAAPPSAFHSPFAAPPAAPAPPAAQAEGVRRLRFHGNAGSLFGIQLVNLFLTLATLGIYAPWARVKVRSYLFSQTDFDGDRFAYHGTGQELFLGYLKALLVFGIPFYGLTLLPQLLGAGAFATAAAELVAYAVVAVFVPVAMVGARRYRLSRTSWRGIRFGFRGETLSFVRLFVAGGLLTALTLGIYYPVWLTRRQAFLVAHSRFGSQGFRFDGDGRELRVTFFKTALLLIPTLGLSWFWFKAAKDRYFAWHTTFGAARLHSTVTGRDLLALKLGNAVLLIATLGLALPWTTVRTARATLRWLSVRGALDVDAVLQQAQAVSATGEGLSGFFDTGFDLG